MAAGSYKNGVQIDLVYQAAALLSNAIPVGTVYDEGSAVHSAETTALTSSLLAGELADPADGRYLGHFTPDAEGLWTVVIKDKNGAGEVTKIYNVCGHDIDSIGDAVAALPATISDIESALNIAISSIDALGAEDIASQLLITKSAIVSSILVDCNASTSDVKSAVTAWGSDVKSAVTVTSGYAASAATSAKVASQLLLTQSTLSGYISNVESAVDLIGDPASIS